MLKFCFTAVVMFVKKKKKKEKLKCDLTLTALM